MVRNSTDTRNSLLQLTKRGQISNIDQEAIDVGDDSAAPEDHHHHAPEESVITQVGPALGSRMPHAAFLMLLAALCDLQQPKARPLAHPAGLMDLEPALQVNQRTEKQPATGLHYSTPSDAPLEGQVSWKERLRALFCCFVPDASEQYYRSSEGEATVIRPPQPPTPPAYRGEPVIGALQACIIYTLACACRRCRAICLS